jgi:hypothetical protein
VNADGRARDGRGEFFEEDGHRQVGVGHGQDDRARVFDVDALADEHGGGAGLREGFEVGDVVQERDRRGAGVLEVVHAVDDPIVSARERDVEELSDLAEGGGHGRNWETLDKTRGRELNPPAREKAVTLREAHWGAAAGAPAGAV